MHGVEMSPSKENVIAGGVPNSTMRLAKKLQTNGTAVFIVTNDRKYRETGAKVDNFNDDSVKFFLFQIKHKYPSLKFSLIYFIKTLREIKRIKDHEHPNIIHGHSGRIELAIITGVASKYANVPCVHTIYCPIKDSNSRYNLLLAKFINRYVSKLIAISDNVRLSLRSIGITENKIEFIPPIIDFDKFRPGAGGVEVRHSLGIADDEFMIFYLGNLTLTKGFGSVLDAMHSVKEERHKVKLVTGLEFTHTATGERESEFQDKINDLGLGSDIIGLGLISNVERFMDAADIVVAPFQHTFDVADYPMTILEAMAVGTPVITTPVGGIPEIMINGINGILIPSCDPSTLSSAIMDLIKDPEKIKKIGNKAAFDIRRSLPDAEIRDKMINAYNQTISQNQRCTHEKIPRN
jgi:glycosyltransferase involved in cell wall biosynthesis